MNGVIVLMLLIKAEGAVRKIEAEEVQYAINRMEIREASEHLGVAVELCKASGDKCLKCLTSTSNDIYSQE